MYASMPGSTPILSRYKTAFTPIPRNAHHELSAPTAMTASIAHTAATATTAKDAGIPQT